MEELTRRELEVCSCKFTIYSQAQKTGKHIQIKANWLETVLNPLGT